MNFDKPLTGFSPKGPIQDWIVQAFNAEKVGTKLLMYSYTNSAIEKAQLDMIDRGAWSKNVLDRIQTNGAQAKIHDDIETKIKASGNPKSSIALLSPKGGIMHIKGCVFVGLGLMTFGSFNWTERAQNANYEIAHVTSDPALVKALNDEFDRVSPLASLEVPISQREHERVERAKLAASIQY